jgi:glutaredoxin 3
LAGRKAFMMGNKSGVDSRTKEFIRNEISTQDVSMPLHLIGASYVSLNLFQVVIFSKSYCPYCTKTKQLFSGPVGKDYSVKVVELDKLKDGSDIQDELLAMTGQRTVPNVFIKGKHLGGNDDTHAALASGKLQAMLSAL